MHTFVSVLPDRTVYVDVEEHEPGRPFPGWIAICRAAVLAQGLMTEEEAKDATFHSAVRPGGQSGFR